MSSLKKPTSRTCSSPRWDAVQQRARAPFRLAQLMLRSVAMNNEDLPPHLRERSSQPEPQPQLPLEPPPEDQPLPPLPRTEPQGPAEPYLRRS